MGIMLHSPFLWVMQGLYHQPYLLYAHIDPQGTFRGLGKQVEGFKSLAYGLQGCRFRYPENPIYLN